MEPQNLQTASLYVNNLLLSRGLLRNGTPIEFAKPSKTEGGAKTGMAQIINLVHDLVLRRDRETDTLTTLSQGMQALRSTAAQQTQAVARLESRSTDLERQLALSVAQERSAKARLRSAENRNRVLREEMGRLKVSVAQIRGQCANDIRKRDMEIKRLKRHLEDRRGREGNSSQVGVVVVTPGINKSNSGSFNTNPGTDGESSSSTLKEETNAFLTHLNRTLSTENEALTTLAQTTLSTLRNLQGLPSHPSSPSSTHPPLDPHVLLTAPPTYESLAASTATTLSQLRSLLTNPSFVSLEEVEIREDEIIRLREGWDTMEARWREAVTMMDGWRKRMMETGDTVNLDDLRKGLEMGEEVARLSPWKERDEERPGGEESVLSGSGVSGGAGEDETVRLSSPESQSRQLHASAIDLGMGLFPAPSILQPASGNTQRSRSPRKVSPPRATALESSDSVDLVDAGDRSSSVESPDPTPSKTGTRQFTPSKRVVIRQREQYGTIERVLSVQEKLERAQKEAEDARRREKRAEEKEDKGKGVAPKSSGLPKLKARAGRRRSTLSPEELEGLLGLS